MNKLSVLIVDDNPLYVVAATRFLTDVCGVDVVGVAASGDEGIARATALRPDLVLIDQGMSGMSGLEASAKLRTLKKPPAVVIVTLNVSRQLLEHAIENGCEAVLSKIDFTRDIPSCLDALRSRRLSDGAVNAGYKSASSVASANLSQGMPYLKKH